MILGIFIRYTAESFWGAGTGECSYTWNSINTGHINIVTWNINGCGTPLKRKKILMYLKSKGTDIAYIQETHFSNQDETLKMKRCWVGSVFHNSTSSNSFGVAILINKKLNFFVLNQFKNSCGRLLVVEALINGVKVVLCNINTPNKENTSFFHEVNKILGKTDGPIILGGDYNQTTDDSSPYITGGIIWRLLNPTERKYTFYSHSHRSYSRIDFFLVSNSLVDSVTYGNIGVIAISDHALVELHIDLHANKDKTGRWRLNTSLLHDEQFTTKLGEEIQTFLDINRGTTEILATVWDALKLKLHEIYNKKADYSLFRLKTNFYENGEKAGRLMARQLKRIDSNNTITAIRKDAKLIASVKKINEVFQNFYEDLYTSTCSASGEDFDSFFRKVELPELPTEDKDSLDTTITETEVRTAIKVMRSGKSPGVDGFLVEYYKKYVDIIIYDRGFPRSSPLWFSPRKFQ